MMITRTLTATATAVLLLTGLTAGPAAAEPHCDQPEPPPICLPKDPKPKPPKPSHDPIGRVDTVRVAADGLRVTGWALDRDTTASIQVRLTVDGKERKVELAALPRPDVEIAYPGFGSAHGFDVVIPGSGRHTSVCAEGINVGLGASRSVGCGADPRAVSVLDLNLYGITEDLLKDDRSGTATVPWHERYDRVARWMQGNGTVPDVIVLQEAWIRKKWAFFGHYDPADYQTLFHLIRSIQNRTGVKYRIAFADAPFTRNGVNHLHAGPAMLYNPARLHNATAAISETPVDETNYSRTGLHMREGFPCESPLPNEASMCSLIDGDGRHWANSYTATDGRWLRGPTAAVFELAAEPGQHVLIGDVHVSEPGEESNAATRDLVDGLWSRWRSRAKLLAPIVTGDFNGDFGVEHLEPALNDDVDFVLIGKRDVYPATVVPRTVSETFPRRTDNQQCGGHSDAVSDHCALFTQFLPTS